VMKKLRDMAFGQDARGCYKEPSARVRSAAQYALSACEMVTPPGPPVPELPKPETGAPKPERGVPTPAPIQSPPAAEQPPARLPQPKTSLAPPASPGFTGNSGTGNQQVIIPEPGANSRLAARITSHVDSSLPLVSPVASIEEIGTTGNH
jgi:hypothetical protein